MTNYTLRRLKVPVFKNGECIYNFPELDEIRAHCARELNTMWEEVLRFDNPHHYYVDLSEKLWTLKHEMIDRAKNRGKIEK